MKFSTPSYKKPAGLRPSDQNRSLVSDLSPSELESWLKRRKSVHKSFVDENSPTDRRQSNANNDVVIDVDALMNHVNNNASTGVNDNSKRRKKKRGSDDSSNKIPNPHPVIQTMKRMSITQGHLLVFLRITLLWMTFV